MIQAETDYRHGVSRQRLLKPARRVKPGTRGSRRETGKLPVIGSSGILKTQEEKVITESSVPSKLVSSRNRKERLRYFR